MRPRVSPWAVGALYALIVLAQFQLRAPQARAVTIGVLAVGLLWLLWRRERGVPREERYALAPQSQD
ncbi:hypothetical protein M5C99_08030 [Acidovorax sp. NCPPB 2350]|nr:hypothetical protein M5C99_08030 [Acidovorax sp. NCPPB 2350]